MKFEFVKKWSKRIVAVSLITAMAVGFAGCGETAQTDGNVTKVVWWKSSGHDKTFMQEKFKQFNETVGKEMGIVLEYVAKEGNLEEMIDLAYTSDQAPDIFNTYMIEKRAQQDQIAAYEDIPGTEKLIEKFGGRALEIRHQYQGKTYTLPVTSGTYGLIYNKQMFIDAGLVDDNGDPKPPVTWDEVVEYAKILTNVEKQEYGIIFPGKWGGFYTTDINMASSAINGLTDAYDPATGTFDYSAQAEVMDAMVRIKRDGSCVSGIEGLDNDPARARFGQGGIGMKIAGSYDAGVLKNQFPAKIEWGVAPLPVLDAAAPAGLQYCSADGLFSINKASVERIGAEKLVAIMEFFSSDEILVEKFKEGLSIPCDYSIVKDVEIPDDMENWKIFASFAEFSKCPPVEVKSEMTGEKTMGDICLEILNEMPEREEILKIFEDYEAKKNEGIKKYQEINPDYDPSLFIYEDWNCMR